MSSVCGMLRILEGAIDAIPSSRFTPATCAAIFDLAAVWGFGATCAAIFDLAAVWGFGGALSGLGNVDARKVFSEWWREELVTFGGIPLPSIGNVFDYAYDPVTFSVCTWHDFVSKTKYLGIVERDVMVISTPFQVCCARLLALHTSSGAPMLLSGAHGSGKTTAIMEHLTGQVRPARRAHL
ncbi:hypothetical protein T484DRAFT_1763809 [Baffinella frigidus]|nr:hypothetical protein T484DRAFT_1763809 [Cryptophyta sp. CCMP2293]